MATTPAPAAPQRALTKQERSFTTLRTLLDSDAMRKQLTMALPKHITVDRLIRVALTSINKVPALLDCTQDSVFAAIIESAQLGLMPDGILGEGYLIPYGNVCQFQPGYRGLISLARRSGQVSDIYAELVSKLDKFEVTYGLKKTMVHEPDIDNPDRLMVDEHNQIPDLRGAYAVVIFTDGTVNYEYLPLARMIALRQSSKANKSSRSPWNTPLAVPEMYRKQPIRALAKRLPLSPEFQRAAIIDEYVEAGIDPKLVDEHIDPKSELARAATENRTREMAEAYRPQTIEGENLDAEPENPQPATEPLQAESASSSPAAEASPSRKQGGPALSAKDRVSTSTSTPPEHAGLGKGELFKS